MTDRDRARLVGVSPVLVAKYAKVDEVLASAGRPIFVVQGVRTLEQQEADFAKGRTTKGPRVTNADGISKLSKHQLQADGLGHAIDAAFVGPEPFAPEHPWQLFGQVAKDQALVWGGDFIDRPGDFGHVELP